ncbi:unnamed protein product [Polarella glacialis]|uniref:Uncharacterized protein n=1 Tax=Polarella glacialis TaxID=89957 RepID=A0A813DH60_POLGL|nr:unnamed protein product [Polarella glacialis]
MPKPGPLPVGPVKRSLGSDNGSRAQEEPPKDEALGPRSHKFPRQREGSAGLPPPKSSAALDARSESLAREVISALLEMVLKRYNHSKLPEVPKLLLQHRTAELQLVRAVLNEYVELNGGPLPVGEQKAAHDSVVSHYSELLRSLRTRLSGPRLERERQPAGPKFFENRFVCSPGEDPAPRDQSPEETFTFEGKPMDYFLMKVWELFNERVELASVADCSAGPEAASPRDGKTRENQPKQVALLAVGRCGKGEQRTLGSAATARTITPLDRQLKIAWGVRYQRILMSSSTLLRFHTDRGLHVTDKS